MLLVSINFEKSNPQQSVLHLAASGSVTKLLISAPNLDWGASSDIVGAVRGTRTCGDAALV